MKVSINKAPCFSGSLLCLLVAASACSGGAENWPSEESIETDTEGPEIVERTLAELEVGGGTVKFVVSEVDGEVAAVEVEESYATSNVPPLGNPSIPDATYLELYVAASGNAESPPIELVEAHEASGRDRDVIREVTFDRTVPKSYSWSDCYDYMLTGYNNLPKVTAGDQSNSSFKKWNVNGGNALLNEEGHGLQHTFSMGICADTYSAVGYKQRKLAPMGSSSWTTKNYDEETIEYGEERRWRGGPNEGWKLKAAVYAKGADHHVFTGWATVVPPP